MGLSSSKQKTTTNQKTSENVTTTPQNPKWVTDSIAEYTARLGAFGDTDPNSFIAPASPLQNMAWNNANSLADWQPQARLAAQQAQAAGQKPANVATAQSWTPQTAQASSYQAPTLGNAQTYGAPNLGDASIVSARGYNAPNLGNAQGYAAARVGSPIGASAEGYNATKAGGVNLGPAANAQASDANAQSLLSNFSDYRNPYTGQVVNAAMADFDQQAGQLRAQQSAQAAKNKAFGGSRFALREAQTEGELARARNSQQAQLLDQGFRTAAQLSGEDAGRRQQASLFNAQNRTGVSLANAGFQQQRNLAQGELDQGRNLFNAAADTSAAAAIAAARNQANMFNADSDLRAKMTQAGLDSQAAQHTADANNQYGLARAGMQADAAKFGAAAGNAADAQSAASRNQFALAQAGMQADAARTNAAAQNQFALTGAGMQADAGQFNAASQNQFGLANMAAQNQAAAQNADAQNRTSMFNAGQQDNAATRQLQSAGMLGDMANQYGAGVRQDLGLMSDMGSQQRAIEQQYAMAPMAQLQMLGQLYGTTPYQLFSGRNVSGTGTMSGTSTMTSSPSLFNQVLGAASMFAPAAGGLFKGGGGGFSGSSFNNMHNSQMGFLGG